MSKRHFQATRVFAAEDALPGATMSWLAARALLERACADYDIPVPTLTAGDSLRVSPEGVVLPKRPRPATVLHAAAHLLTDPHFPPHGAEFVERWLDLVVAHSPALGLGLAADLDRRKVHGTPAIRIDKVRRGAVYLANNRPGRLVELVLDDPPERVVGSIEGCTRDAVTVGGRELPMDRARYIYKAQPA